MRQIRDTKVPTVLFTRTCLRFMILPPNISLVHTAN